MKRTNNPWKSSTGELPILRDGKQNVCDFKGSCELLKRNNYNADFDLTPELQCTVTAYSKLLQEKLYPALQYIWWVDCKNYIDLTRPWYAKALPFPLNYFLPGHWQRRAVKKLSDLYGLSADTEFKLENLVYKQAHECLTLLSTRLGEHEFFFGKSPCSVDAIIFAYLAPLLKAPFPNAALQNHLKSYDNLCRFVIRIIHRYFPSNPEDVAEKVQEKVVDDEFPHKRRNQFLSGLFAVCAMVGYALMSGIVKVEIAHDAEDIDGERNESAFTPPMSDGDAQEE